MGDSDATSTTCIACGAALDGSPLVAGSFAYGAPGSEAVWSYRLLGCPTCGMGRLHPAPSAQTLSALYNGGYDAYHGDAQSAAQSRLQRLKMVLAGVSAAALQSSNFAVYSALIALSRGAELACARSVPLTASVPLSLPKGAAILDFGCGAGFWLLAMQSSGYSNLSAFDVQQPALASLSASGVTSFADDPGTLPDGAFDCIRMEHVLEHLVDPAEALRLLRGKLNRRGTIALTVPNFASASRERLGSSWRALKLPHHLSHFTVSALQRVVSRAGLQIKRVRFLPISELALPRPKGAASQLGWRLRRHWYHAAAMDRPSAEFLSAELEPL